MIKQSNTVRKLVYSAVCLALAMVLPFLTGQVPEIGNLLSPMHIPVLLCGFVCGWNWGTGVGFVAPFLRFALFSKPPMPFGVAIAFQLATYGLLAGLFYRLLPKKKVNVYISLVAAMLAGRVVWGVVRFIIAGLQGSSFPMSAFIGGAFLEGVPGIILHIILVPAVVIALDRAKLIPE